MDAPSLRGLLPHRFLSRKGFSCFIFPGGDDSIQDAPTPIARPIEIPPPEKLQSLSPIRTATAAENPDSNASSPPPMTPIDATPSFELFTPPRPSLAPPGSNLKHLRRLKDLLNTLVRPHLPKMRRRASILRPRVLKMMFRSASTLQRHLGCPVRGLQRLRLHDRRLSSLLHRSRRPSCRAHNRIGFLRLPSQRFNPRLQHRICAFPCRHTARTNTCATWGLDFYTWLPSSEELVEGSLR
jgi:hypothetical protein